MKRICVFLFIGVIVSVSGAAEEMSADQWRAANQAAGDYFSTLADEVAAGEAEPIKCGTPLYTSLFLNRPKGVTDQVLYTEREDSMSFTYATDYFMIHYTNNGGNAVYEYGTQTIEPGHPDYIVLGARALDSVYEYNINTLGFSPPPSDGTLGGGNGLYDVYVVNIGAYGVTVLEELQVTLPRTSTTYLFLENDYQGFPGYENSRLDAFRVSAAHEFFHGIQFGIDIDEVDGSGSDLNPAWLEMSAVYMEEEHYDDINDYYNYLRFFYDVPQWSLRTGTQQYSAQNPYPNLHMYASVVWPLFLREQYGPTMMKEIWDGCGQVAGSNWLSATDDAIQNLSGATDDFQTMFQEFALWNYFTGTRIKTGSYFPEAVEYDMAPLTATITQYPITLALGDSVPSKDSLLPDNLGANYVLLANLTSIGVDMMVTFEPDSSAVWGITAVGHQSNLVNLPFDIINARSDTLGSFFIIDNPSQYDRIAVVATVLSGDALEMDYSLSFAPVSEQVFQPNGGEDLFVGTTYDIRWNFMTEVDSVLIEYSINNGATWIDIATTVNNLVYDWSVPATPSDSCLVRISKAQTGTPVVESEDVFSIRSVTGQEVSLGPNPAWIGVRGNETMNFFGRYAVSPGNTDATMTVTVLTLSGEKVWTATESSSNGSIEIQWDYTNPGGDIIAAGPYLAVFEFQGEEIIKKFVVFR